MKKRMACLLLFTLAILLPALNQPEKIKIAPPGESFETVQVSGNEPAGNNRFPAIAENSAGQRLCIWRSGSQNVGMLYAYFNGSSWSAQAPIPGQTDPQNQIRVSNEIVVDSEDRFHVIWEIPKKCVYYHAFSNGQWETPPQRIRFPTNFFAPQGLSIRSTDELQVFTSCRHVKIDQVVGFKGKTESAFGHWYWLTADNASDIGHSLCADENDKLWCAYKTDWRDGRLVVVVALLGINNEREDRWALSLDLGGNSFLPWISSNNNNGMRMVTWWQNGSGMYYASWLKSGSANWSTPKELGVTSRRLPDFSMISKSVAHGNNFYCIIKGMGGRLKFLSFDCATEVWSAPSEVTADSINSLDIFAAYDKILVTYEIGSSPTQIYVATMAVEPEGGRSPHLVVKHLQDNSFLHSYWFNRLTWKLPNYYIKNNLEIKHFHIFRKKSTDTAYGTTPLVEIEAQATPTADYVYQYDDQDPVVNTPTLAHNYKATVVFVNKDGQEEESK